MMDQARHRARYRLLLRAYPKAHRQRSCDEMEEAFITLLFGVLLAFRTDAAGGAHLRDGTRAGISRAANRFGSALVVLQTAMAVALLGGGGLLMKSISGMRAQDYGFEPSNVLTVRVALPTESYDSREPSDAFWADITSRVAGVPGVSAVGTAQNHPLMGSNWGRTVRIAGHNTGEESGRSVRVTHASTGLFQALAFALGGAMSGILVGVSPTDPVTFGTVAFVLATASICRRNASLGPIRCRPSARSSGGDPLAEPRAHLVEGFVVGATGSLGHVKAMVGGLHYVEDRPRLHAGEQGLEQVESCEPVPRALQEEHRQADLREVRAALVGVPARRVQRKAEERESQNPR